MIVVMLMLVLVLVCRIIVPRGDSPGRKKCQCVKTENDEQCE